MTSQTMLSTPQAAWLVTLREIESRLRSKPFLVSTAFLILVALAGVVASAVIAGSASDGYRVAVTPEAYQVVREAPGLSLTEVPDRAAAEKLVRDGTVAAAILTGPGQPGLLLLGDTEVPGPLVGMLSVAPEVELLDPPPDTGPSDSVRYLVAVVFGLMFLMSASLFGTMIAQSVVEEKQTRIVEILLAAIPSRALLAGKVVGNTLLSVAQVVVFALIGLLGLALVGQLGQLTSLAGAFGWFAVFFLFGFVLLAALYSAAGALVSRQEDIGATTFPLMILVIAPYLLVVTLNSNPVALTVLSYVPFSAPVGMPLRVYLGEAGWWEPVAALVILIATCVAAVWLGARIYANSLLKMGSRVRWREALHS
ncbi:MAG: ABC transporter permease [Propionicimonas sp.]|uniref:ABC transporter permease n=1 Tax=Propionicimonas sp. TaxID=1955623 RepID=UPI002B1FA04E|nr:ABC transporter permease [Propionicimonas sp.]MEA4943567.1 ABC transporter permease [Propionicimonas sp.]